MMNDGATKTAWHGAQCTKWILDFRLTTYALYFSVPVNDSFGHPKPYNMPEI